jgi:hypothetical protein
MSAIVELLSPCPRSALSASTGVPKPDGSGSLRSLVLANRCVAPRHKTVPRLPILAVPLRDGCPPRPTRSCQKDSAGCLELLVDATLPSLKSFTKEIYKRKMSIDGITLGPRCGFSAFVHRSITGERGAALEYIGGALSMSYFLPDGEEPPYSLNADGTINFPGKGPSASRASSPKASAPRESHSRTRPSHDDVAKEE